MMGMAELRKRYKRTRFHVDRHGNHCWYTLNPQGKKIRMHEEPGSAAWVAEHEMILAGKEERRGDRGTLAEMINAYMRSTDWRDLAKATQNTRRGVLLDVRKKAGDLPAKSITSKDIRAGRDERRNTPAAANVRIKILSALYSWGIENDFVDHNPAKGVKRLKMRSGGFHTWTLEECLQFEARHPVGTRARAAYALALYTGSRRSDVARLGPRDLTADGIRITQQKTGVTGVLPVVDELRDALQALPMTGLQSFISTKFGKPFTVDGLGKWFKARCREAGLSNDCQMHGLRKAIVVRLFEAGATIREVRAVTLHMSDSEVETYAREANQKLLARKAMGKL